MLSGGKDTAKKKQQQQKWTVQFQYDVNHSNKYDYEMCSAHVRLHSNKIPSFNFFVSPAASSLTICYFITNLSSSVKVTCLPLSLIIFDMKLFIKC